MANQLLTRETRLSLHLDEVTLEGQLAIPEGSQGLVIFAHGSGSSRHSPRNRWVARRLHEAHLATVLFDLLTEGEQARDQASGELRFDISFLAQRLSAAVDFVIERPGTHNMMLGLFGASTGAAATLMTAARHPSQIAAIVSRGGRPDLAWQSLPQVKAPTLLIVGEMDRAVIELNRRAFAQLQSEKRFEIVSGASHLFEEPGTLDAVANLAAQWFARSLSSNQERLTSTEA